MVDLELKSWTTQKMTKICTVIALIVCTTLLLAWFFKMAKEHPFQDEIDKALPEVCEECPRYPSQNVTRVEPN